LVNLIHHQIGKEEGSKTEGHTAGPCSKRRGEAPKEEVASNRVKPSNSVVVFSSKRDFVSIMKSSWLPHNQAGKD